MNATPAGENLPVYASLSTIKQEPSQADMNNGVIPLDTLPAAWWNWLWNALTAAQNDSQYNDDIIFTEINNVITAAGLTPGASTQHDQLIQAIRVIKDAIATIAAPGSVISTEGGTTGTVMVAADGKMTVNNFGDIASFHGASKGNLMEALNETYDMAYNSDSEVGDISGLTTTDTTTLVSAINEVKQNADSRAIKMHRSATTEYGVGNGTEYGHVRLTDVISASDKDDGVAATPKMVQGVITNSINTLNSLKFDYVIHDQRSFEDILLRNMDVDPLHMINDKVNILLRAGHYVVDTRTINGEFNWKGRICLYGDASAEAARITFVHAPTGNYFAITGTSSIVFYNIAVRFVTFGEARSEPFIQCANITVISSVLTSTRFATPNEQLRDEAHVPDIEATYIGGNSVYDMTGFDTYTQYGIGTSVLYIRPRMEFGSRIMYHCDYYIIKANSLEPLASGVSWLRIQYTNYDGFDAGAVTTCYIDNDIDNVRNSDLMALYSGTGNIYADNGITKAGESYPTGSNRVTILPYDVVGAAYCVNEGYVYTIPIKNGANSAIYPVIKNTINIDLANYNIGKRVKEIYAFYDWGTGTYSNNGVDGKGNTVVFNVRDCTESTITAYNSAAPANKRIQCLWVELEDV